MLFCGLSRIFIYEISKILIYDYVSDFHNAGIPEDKRFSSGIYLCVQPERRIAIALS